MQAKAGGVGTIKAKHLLETGVNSNPKLAKGRYSPARSMPS